MKTQELTIIEQPEFTEVVKSSKIDLTKAQEHALAFAPSMTQYHELALVLSDLNKVNPSADDAKKAREARLKMVKIRTGSETIKDERKAIMLIESNLIQDLYNVVKNTCALTESEFLAIEKHQERIEAEKLEKIAQSRIKLLEKYGEINQFVDLKSMDEETFQKYLSNEKLAFETREAQEKQAELDRIESEKKAEAERLAKIEADRVEQERIKKKNEELRLANEAKEKELAKEREIQAEKDRLAKIDQEKKEAEITKLKAEQEAEKQRKEKELADEKARIEAEEADKMAKEKAAMLAPDKEKVKAFYLKFEALRNEFPELTSELGIALSIQVKESLLLVKGIIIDQSKKLL